MSSSEAPTGSSSQSAGQIAEERDQMAIQLKQQAMEMRRIKHTLRDIQLSMHRILLERSQRSVRYHIKYRLDENQDKKLIRQMKVEGVLERLRNAGYPFNRICAIDFGNHMKYIFFIFKNKRDEVAVRETAVRISPILGLSVHCHAVPMPYMVEARGLSRYKVQQMGLYDKFENPERCVPFWSHENDVSIRNAFFKKGRLLLTLATEEDALKVARTGVFLHNKWSRAIPRDIEAFEKYCVNCYGINHLKDECRRQKPRCGWCAEDHATSECEKNDPDKRDNLKCLHCGDNDHPAWSNKCNDPKVLRMRAECKERMRRGPAWAPKIATFLSNDEPEGFHDVDDDGASADDSDYEQVRRRAGNRSAGGRYKGKRVVRDESSEEPSKPPKRRSPRLSDKIRPAPATSSSSSLRVRDRGFRSDVSDFDFDSDSGLSALEGDSGTHGAPKVVEPDCIVIPERR